MALQIRSQRYRSYLLRFWHESAEKTTRLDDWRFMLEDPHTGERLGFANLDKLVEHLNHLMNSADTLSDLPSNSQIGAAPLQNNVSEDPGARATQSVKSNRKPKSKSQVTLSH